VEEARGDHDNARPRLKDLAGARSDGELEVSLDMADFVDTKRLECGFPFVAPLRAAASRR